MMRLLVFLVLGILLIGCFAMSRNQGAPQVNVPTQPSNNIQIGDNQTSVQNEPVEPVLSQEEVGNFTLTLEDIDLSEEFDEDWISQGEIIGSD